MEIWGRERLTGQCGNERKGLHNQRECQPSGSNTPVLPPRLTARDLLQSCCTPSWKSREPSSSRAPGISSGCSNHKRLLFSGCVNRVTCSWWTGVVQDPPGGLECPICMHAELSADQRRSTGITARAPPLSSQVCSHGGTNHSTLSAVDLQLQNTSAAHHHRPHQTAERAFTRAAAIADAPGGSASVHAKHSPAFSDAAEWVFFFFLDFNAEFIRHIS